MISRHVIKVQRKRRSPVVNLIPPSRQRFYRRLGETIRTVRVERLMTQEDLAKKVGLSRSSVANIECGRQQIMLHQASAFAKALKVDKGEFLP